MPSKNNHRVRFRVKPLCAALLFAFSVHPAYANPTGGVVVSGQASFSTAGNTLTVTNTPGTIINWQSFSVGTSETTRFAQQNAASAVLNRVVTSNPSSILGTLSSNGRVFLVNPNGVVFGQGATIDVAGLVATTLNLSDADFLAGRYNFTQVPGAQNISNAGNITAQNGGEVYLIAPNVENTGVINAPNGEILLAAGHSVELVNSSEPNLRVSITAPAGDATSVGRLIAEAGSLGLFGTVVRNSGTVSANSAVMQGGKIVFKASQDTYIDKDAQVSATGTKGGAIEVLGSRVAVMDNAQLDASGQSGGGSVLIGGDYQGKNSEIQNASITYFGPNAGIKANAIENGDGGKVVIWANDITRAYGNISAKGGVNGGNGGFVEVSGKNYLDFQGRVNTLAPRGIAGTLLLDPTDITINTVGPDNYAGGSFSGGIFSGTTSNATLTWSTINSQTGSLEIRTTSPGGTGGSGDINISASGSVTGPTTFTLLANRDINIGPGVSVTSSNDINMIAGWNNTGWAVTSGVGNINFGTGSSLSTSGNLWFNAGNSVSQNPTGTSVTANVLTIGNTNGNSLPGGVSMLGNNMVNTLAVQIDSSGSLYFNNGQSLAIGSGAYSINGIMASGNTSPISITTTSGNLTVSQPIVADVLGGGPITLTAANTLTLNAAITSTFNATPAGPVRLQAGAGGITSNTNGIITAAGLKVTSGGSVVLNAANNIDTLAGTSTSNFEFSDSNGFAVGIVDGTIGLTASNNNIFLKTGGGVNSPLTISNNVQATTGNVTYITDNLAHNAFTTTSGSPGAFAEVIPYTPSTAIEFSATADATGFMRLSSGELNFSTPLLKVGNSSMTGGIAFTQAVTPTAFSSLSLITSGTITQTAGSTINIANLNADGWGGVVLNEANNVTTLAGHTNAGNFSFRDANSINIGLVDVNNGIDVSTSGNVAIVSADNIILNSGSLISTGAGNVTLNSDFDGLNGGAISMATGSSIASNGGNITLGGGTGGIGAGYAIGNAGYINGIYLEGATLNAGGGSITLNGTGFAGTSGANGIYLTNASTLQTSGAGMLLLDGIGGAGVSDNNGIRIGNNSSISADAGSIFVTGQGGSSTGLTNMGVYIHNNAAITTNTGSILLDGTGGSVGTSGDSNRGVRISGSAITSNSGFIDVIGVAGYGGDGVQIIGGSTIQSTAGGVSIDGTSGDTTTWSYGAWIGGAGTTVTSGGSGIFITGTSAATTAGNNNHGVVVDTGAKVTATSGVLALDGTSGFGASSNAVFLSGTPAGGVVNSASALSITGTGDVVVDTGSVINADVVVDILATNNILFSAGSSLVSSSGANILLASDYDGVGGGGITLNTGSSINSNGGDIIMGGGVNPVLSTAAGGEIGILDSTLDAGSGNISLTGCNLPTGCGVLISGSNVQTTSGDIGLYGTAGNLLSAATGVSISSSSSVTTTGGNISITGFGGSLSYGASILGNSQVSTQGAGSISITGTGGIAGALNRGVWMNAGSSISTVNGAISITGIGGGDGTGASNEGISIDASTIQSTGTGTIALNGASGIGTGSDYGLVLSGGATVASGGGMTITGTSTSAAGSNNHGVVINSGARVTSSGMLSTISITGTSGAGATSDAVLLSGTPAGGVVNSASTLTIAGFGDVMVDTGSVINVVGAADILATNNIQFSANSALASSSSAVNVVLNSDSDASGSGAITMLSGSSISSGGGNITMGGGANPATGYAVGSIDASSISNCTPGVCGISLLGATTSIDSGGGNISLRGMSYAGGNGAVYVGVWSDAIINSGSGTIMIDGVSQGGGSSNSQGVILTGTLTSANATASAITVTGSHTGTTTAQSVGLNTLGNNGSFLSSATIQTTNGGGINLFGTGGTSTAPGGSVGIYLAGDVLSNGGEIRLVGTGGSAPGSESIYGIAGAQVGDGTSGNILLRSTNASRIALGTGTQINAGANALTFSTAGGVVTDLGAGLITAGSLRMLNTAIVPGSNFNFTNPVNNAGTIAANLLNASLAYTDANLLTIGSVTGFDGTTTTTTNGITGFSNTVALGTATSDINANATLLSISGTMTLNPAGDIRFMGGVTSASAAGMFLDLNPGGGIFTDAGSTITLSGTDGAVAARVLNGKTWSNSGTINIGGLGAYINLGGPGTPATLANLAGGAINVDIGGWALSSNSGSQNGIFTNAGTVNVNTSNSFEAAFSNTGTLNLNNASTVLSLQNAQSMAGTININNSTATLWISEIHGSPASFSGTTINGSGTLLVSGVGANSWNYPIANFSSATLNGITLTAGNQGTINWTGGTLAGTGIINTSGSGAFNIVTGTYILNGPTLNLSSLTLTGASLSIQSGALNLSSMLTLSNGSTLLNNGTVSAPSLYNYGLLGGGGSITGNVFNDGVVAPGNSPGAMSITGNYTQGPAATLAVELGGTTSGSYDALSVTGIATLDGALSVSMFGGYTGNVGDIFPVISASSISGTFATVSTPAGYTFGTNYLPSSFELALQQIGPVITAPVLDFIVSSSLPPVEEIIPPPEEEKKPGSQTVAEMTPAPAETGTTPAAMPVCQ